MENNIHSTKSDEKFIGKNFNEFMKEYRLEKTKDDFFSKTSTLIIASFGLVAALAWEDAAKDLFQEIFGTMGTLPAKLLYALLATTLAVGISLLLRRIALKKISKETTEESHF